MIIRIQTEQDEAALFAFLGQVKDRMLYHVSDPVERIVPPLLSSSSQDGSGAGDLSNMISIKTLKYQT
jgi:hypothetical protein